MRRGVYQLLVELHPRDFRVRFGEEMLAICDEAGAPLWLITDGVKSLAWQRRGMVPVVALTALAWFPLTWLITPAAFSEPTRTPLAPLDLYLLAAVATVLVSAATALLALTWRRIRRHPARRRYHA